MSKVAGKVRSDDAVRLKPHLPRLAGITDDRLLHKSNRGFLSAESGRQLCPIALRNTFDDNPVE